MQAAQPFPAEPASADFTTRGRVRSYGASAGSGEFGGPGHSRSSGDFPAPPGSQASGDFPAPARSQASGEFPGPARSRPAREPASHRRAASPGFVPPADIRPADIRPADIRPADIRPADIRPADIRPADIRPGDSASFGGYSTSGGSPRPRAAPAMTPGGVGGPPGLRAVGARGTAEITGRISLDGSTGFLSEPGRYLLYASLACPWSQRAMIVRRLLGLERVIGLSLVDPILTEQGWRFPAETGGRDPVTGAQLVADLYLAADPGYSGRPTLPLLWDTRTNRIVTNDAAQITVQMETEFGSLGRPGAPDLYPPAQRREIDAIATLIHHTVNNGVYKAGLATTQASYEEAFDALFTTLDALEERLARRRFLLGPRLTEADVRLFPTLARFDAVYYLLCKCNLHRLAEYPYLWAYARDLYQRPGFGDTTDFVQIKLHYYQAQSWLNPSRIVAKGPYVSWLEPHNRGRMPG
jgi:glutathionyl-hydroquinone reductase